MLSAQHFPDALDVGFGLGVLVGAGATTSGASYDSEDEDELEEELFEPDEEFPDALCRTMDGPPPRLMVLMIKPIKIMNITTPIGISIIGSNFPPPCFRVRRARETCDAEGGIFSWSDVRLCCAGSLPFGLEYFC